MSQSEIEETMMGSLRMNKLPVPVREYQFAQSLGRKWRFDMAWPEQRVALEVEGGTWIKSKHTTGAGIERDIEKGNFAALMGWVVIRATKAMVEDNRAADAVRAALLLRGGM